MEYKNLRYGSDYPLHCPPEDCYLPSDEVVYRACKSDILDKNNNLNMDNFIPAYEEEDRQEDFNTDSDICLAKALSFFSNPKILRKKMNKFPRMGNKIIKIKLNKNCGYLKKTNRAHYSLWDLTKPNISEAIGKDWRALKL